jgi:hypothetical protein
VDALHVSSGSFFPHPLNPIGDFPLRTISDAYDTMLSSGTHTLRNFVLFRASLLRPLARWLWTRSQPEVRDGVNLPDATTIKQAVDIPVLVTGAFQDAELVRSSIATGRCDAVTIARPLIANPDLVKMWARGAQLPEKPCSYCNRCLFHVLEDPLGCYDIRRFEGDHEAMVTNLMAFYKPDGFDTKADVGGTEALPFVETPPSTSEVRTGSQPGR